MGEGSCVVTRRLARESDKGHDQVAPPGGHPVAGVKGVAGEIIISS